MKNKFNHSVLVISAAKMTNAALIFLRMAILARLLMPADFGVAATFWITTGILAAITELGIDKILIQDKKGNDAHFGAVAQTLLFARGVIISVLILMFHYQFAIFFDVPEAAYEFALLAILPLLTGLEHRNYITKQRNMDFIPLAMYQIGPELITLILVYPLAVYFSDYRAFVYLSIAAGVARLTVSHIMADAPFRFAWDKELTKKIIRFGWPLTLSSLLLVLTLQGDKLIISQYYSKHELGLFAVAFTFATFIPNNLAGVLTQIMLPDFSKIRDNQKLLIKRVELMNQLFLWISIPGIFILLAYSSELIEFVYGKKFIEVSTIVKIIAVVFFVRLLRMIPNTLCITFGITKSIMFSNMFRQVALIISLILAVKNVELHWIAATGIIGELLAIIAVSFSICRIMECHYSFWIRPTIGLILYSFVAYFLVEGLVTSGMQIILFFFVLIMTGYSAMHALRNLNELNRG